MEFYGDAVLAERLRRLNPGIPKEARDGTIAVRHKRPKVSPRRCRGNIIAK